MIDIFIKLFLSFSNEPMIIPLIILGYIWINKEIFYHSICILLVSMIFSYTLKTYFKIESPIYGLIFPSGHMLCSTSLYGWIAYKMNNIIVRISSLCLLAGIALSLVYKGYHNYYDVIAGVFFSVILIIVYNYMSRNKSYITTIISLLFISLSMIYIYISNGKIPGNLWLAYYAFVGFSFSAEIFKNRNTLVTKIERILASLSFFLSIYLIHYIFRFIEAPNYIFQLKWLLIGFSLPFYCFLTNKFHYKNIQSIK